MAEDARILRIVYLEDDPLDTELVQAKLAEGGISCEITWVETRGQFVGALEDGGWPHGSRLSLWESAVL